MTISFRRVYLGRCDPVRTVRESYNILTSEEQVKQVYAEFVARPPVSFARDVLIVAHRGVCPTGGYVIRVMSVESRGKALVVNLVTSDPGPGDYVSLAATCPNDCVAVSRASIGRPGRYLALFYCAGREVAQVRFEI